MARVTRRAKIAHSQKITARAMIDKTKLNRLKTELQKRKDEILFERQAKDWYSLPDDVPAELKSKVARDAQRPPPGDWRYWLLLGGRGSGKTRAAAEYIRWCIKMGVKSIAFVARTEADVRDTCVLGDSGILNCWDEKNDRDKNGKLIGAPLYKKQERKVVFPNGATIFLYSSNKPDRLRGPNISVFWCDEYAALLNFREVWSNLMFTFRKDSPIGLRGVVSTTPRPQPQLKTLMEDEKCKTTRMVTQDNADNLAPDFITDVVEPLKGSFLYEQEILGKFMMSLPGALWNPEQLDKLKVRKDSVNLKTLSRIVVAVDPAVSAEEDSNETGIVVVGKHSPTDRGYVIDDLSGVYSPNRWVNLAIKAYHDYQADAIIAERNNGGDLIRSAFKAADKTPNVITVWAARGKHTRAEPVAVLYDQNKIYHIGGFPDLETQMSTWVPGEVGGDAIPELDRVDALVWGLTHLFLKHGGKEPVGVPVG